MLSIGFIISLLSALFITPFVKKIAIYWGAVDQPNHRKVHSRIMPRLGGLAIYLAFLISFLLIGPKNILTWGILAGGTIIVLTGALDDRYQLSPKVKLLGQLIAAIVVVASGLKVEFINLPFDGIFIFGWLSIPITIVWIVGISNAINLIDGLDGLAAGVSAIATATILIMSLLIANNTVSLLSVALLGAIIGFLFFNFHPAKIFMGDTGALFLGFMLASMSILGFKYVTLFAFVMPILILGVPISDTFFAIVRRMVHNKPISEADKNHLHHRLLQLGLSHRQAVIFIYFVSMLFGASAIYFSQATLWGALLILGLLLLALELFVEAIGLVSKSYRPILDSIRKIFIKNEQKQENL
ncbi:undecaprenyl-phosphate alpha-N-acetylglucosaminyl 1-phosphate transferase [Vulcanibacillus modesticaldus]|uniref:Undecaprenyl-phosphate alpha-N-acetylglucosaminyl 1-phosphate transferase n=1 Tax=Vulcanibacillus modesticaldus TaxID=337097 RepID=A0A1D2YVS1_9BACI|nr:undecaprenyl-phosphate alpha-N-acetylglucosaminyl 1-phosphate transferase [Vulcanibacillus modesticaldus]